MTRNRKSGFTLVEILIVVIILGILAAIVIPQFTNASQDARKSNLASQVQTLKSQIELYKLQHHDAPPALQTNWDQFTKCTNDQGTVSTAANPVLPDPTTGFQYGPYMQTTPVNPLTNHLEVVDGIGAGKAAADKGFTFDKTTGVIHGIAVDTSAVAHETDDGVTDVNTQTTIN